MATKPLDTQPQDQPVKPAATAGLLTASGVAAAFGAAACCGLPALLASLGIGSAWLASIAYIAAPHEAWLLPAAAIILAISAVFLLRQQLASNRCAPGVACTPVWVRAANFAAIIIGAALVWIGYTLG